MKLKIDNKGLSLPMTIGLLLLLVTITTTVNELVIRALRASHQIEASDKAYFAAEGGIEDALYELSIHNAGYETPPLLDADVRNDNFSPTSIKWKNEWAIKNKGLNTCTNSLATWQAPFFPTYCGQIYEGQKLVINLFTDDASPSGITTGKINEVIADINTLGITDIEIKFRVPKKVETDYPGAFLQGLLIDNDGDLNTSSETGPEGIPGLNEDGAPAFYFSYAPNACPYSGTAEVDDDDCDEKVNEDSKEDPVIMWKLLDGSGHTFQPLRGCKGDPMHSSHDATAIPPTGRQNAMLCEKNFNNGELSASLTQGDWGVDETGQPKLLVGFLADYLSFPNNKEALQMEIQITAPLKNTVDFANSTKITIPYLEYGIQYNPPAPVIPATFFAIQSDGYFQDFKQSITTNVVPQATNRLLDLTIIQQ